MGREGPPAEPTKYPNNPNKLSPEPTSPHLTRPSAVTTNIESRLEPTNLTNENTRATNGSQHLRNDPDALRHRSSPECWETMNAEKLQAVPALAMATARHAWTCLAY